MSQVLSKYEEENGFGEKKTHKRNKVFTVTLYQILLDNTVK